MPTSVRPHSYDCTCVVTPAGSDASFTHSSYLNPESALYSIWGYSEEEYLKAKLLGYKDQTVIRMSSATGQLLPNHVKYIDEAVKQCYLMLDDIYRNMRTWPKCFISDFLS